MRQKKFILLTIIFFCNICFADKFNLISWRLAEEYIEPKSLLQDWNDNYYITKIAYNESLITWINFNEAFSFALNRHITEYPKTMDYTFYIYSANGTDMLVIYECNVGNNQLSLKPHLFLYVDKEKVKKE
ncbi:MAG: hypothetical protein IK015_08050 [Treponema sp.]|nr:hypothetical protein [Treponema sp.]